MNRYAFFGTPDVASCTLEILKENNFIPSVVITAPDRPVGRKQIITPPPVKVWAEENNIPILQPEKFDEEFELELRNYNLDIVIVVAYGKILPKNIIDLPKLGTINIHYSLLPRWRGASPVEAAILAGEAETGVAIQQMVSELDAGDIIATKKTTIEENETAPELRSRLIEIGGKLLSRTLPNILNRKITPVLQEGEPTFCQKIEKGDGEIKLSDPDSEKWRKYRAYFGWPGIFYFDENKKRIKITDAEFLNGEFVIKKIIPEGGKEIPFERYV
jgi:methionyl-tRNA formyltransferase